MGRREYFKEYFRKHFVKVSIRREVWRKLKTYCMSKGWSYSECLEKLLEEASKPPCLSKELEELIDCAVRLANKYPGEEESRKIFQLWEQLMGFTP